MFTEFLEAWTLFGDAWLTGWLLAAGLGACGVLLAARDQVFLGAAVAQATALGLAAALALGGLAAAGASETQDPHAHPHAHGMSGEPDERFALALAAAFGVGGAWLTTLGGRKESREALTAWVFLASSAGAVLLLAHGPHGLEEVKRLHASTLLAATGADLAWSALFALGSAALLAGGWRKLLLLTVDPEMAAAAGLNVARWNALMLAWLGLGLALSIRCAGTLYAFGCLALPALAARQLCRELGAMLAVAPLLALGAAGAGFMLAHRFDLPPAHATVGLLAACLPAACLARRLLR
ncbi:MAG: metal ABC transporter permease [Planctomycetota bacterium]|nr:metal ABC transporter permease [Planctomycetota bacterium]